MSALVGAGRAGGAGDVVCAATVVASATTSTTKLTALLVGVGLLMCVIRASHKRTRFDMDEAARQRQTLQLREFVGMVVTGHRRVRGRRSQILPDSQNRDANAAQIVEHGDDLVDFLAEADDDAGLGRERRTGE